MASIFRTVRNHWVGWLGLVRFTVHNKMQNWRWLVFRGQMLKRKFLGGKMTDITILGEHRVQGAPGWIYY